MDESQQREVMKKITKLFLIAFICNLIGHLFWSLKIFFDHVKDLDKNLIENHMMSVGEQ